MLILGDVAGGFFTSKDRIDDLWLRSPLHELVGSHLKLPDIALKLAHEPEVLAVYLNSDSVLFQLRAPDQALESWQRRRTDRRFGSPIKFPSKLPPPSLWIRLRNADSASDERGQCGTSSTATSTTANLGGLDFDDLDGALYRLVVSLALDPARVRHLLACLSRQQPSPNKSLSARLAEASKVAFEAEPELLAQALQSEQAQWSR